MYMSTKLRDSLLTRALQIVDEISNSPQGLRFSDLKKSLAIPSPSTLSKILRELTQADVLSKTDGGRYVVGMKAYFWGKSVTARRGPIQILREHMVHLHEEFGASVNLFTCYGQYMFCLESVMSSQSPALWPAGKGLPLELPVIGSIFFFSPEQLKDVTFLQAACERHRPRLKLEDVRKMIQEAEHNGMQYDPGLFYPGMYRLALPLKDKGNTTMVLGAGVLEARQERTDTMQRLATAMREAKANIEKELNG